MSVIGHRIELLDPTLFSVSAKVGATIGADAVDRDSLRESPVSLNCIIDHKEKGFTISLAS